MMAPLSSPLANEKDIAATSSEDIISPTSSVKSADLDEAYLLYKQAEQDAHELDPLEAKRVLRKIDRRIVPILFLIYWLQYLDKNGINYASAYGLQTDLKLVGDNFSWLGSIFYFGYLVAQYPAGYLLQRLPIAKFLGCTTILWGVIVITTPACRNFSGIAANRFLLGFVESAVNPGFILIMSMWYTSFEQPLRLEAYYCTNGLATMFGGLIGYAVGHINGGLKRWMYVFIVFGCLSIATGILTLIVLPDSPTKAKFLKEDERIIAVERIAGNRMGVKNHHFKKDQVWQTFRDPKTWMLFIMATGAQVPNTAITQFTSIIIGSFGFNTLGSQYLQIPGGAVQFLSLLAGGIICSRYPNVRCITMIVANTLCIIGAAMLVGLPSSAKWGRLVGLWLCFFQGLGFSMSLTMVSSNVAGYTKKQLTAAILFTGYCVGNIIGPQTFKAKEKPGYHSAYIAMLVGYTVKLGAVCVLYLYMWNENRRRDRKAAARAAAHEHGDGDTAMDEQKEQARKKQGIELGMLDRTELENEEFRYTL